MIEIQQISIRNFLSCGNSTQVVKLDSGDLTLILGENHDLGGEDQGNRNGTGKCVCAHTVVHVRNTSTGQQQQLTVQQLFDSCKTTAAAAVTSTDEHQCAHTGVTRPAAEQLPSEQVQRKFVDSVQVQHLQIATDTGWQCIDGVFKTQPYTVWSVHTATGKTLQCADDHIVFDEQGAEIFVKNLSAGVSLIQTDSGTELVTAVHAHDHAQHMFDISVQSEQHRYYTNGILSHNTTLINAISYALYGQALNSIRKDNLINKTNGKNMLVTLDFRCAGVQYRIERGRRPGVLKLFVNQVEQHTTDASQGDSRETQQAIEQLLSMSHDMFRHVVALNTYTEPFLATRVNEQRSIIEQLLGITLLSEKAERLREQSRVTREMLAQEEMRIQAVSQSNQRIQQQIESVKRKQHLWQVQHQERCVQLQAEITDLSALDLDQEVQLHQQWQQFQEQQNQQKLLLQKQQQLQQQLRRDEKQLITVQKQLDSLQQHQCYVCGGKLQNNTQQVSSKQQEISSVQGSIQLAQEQMLKITSELNQLCLQQPVATRYATLTEAVKHRSNLENLIQQLQIRAAEINPYTDQAQELTEQALEPVSYDQINALKKVQEHEEFLLKLLTNKDSFIRKRIIDQNLAFLNSRLRYYLMKLALPHQVVFENDLSVSITELGRDLDFHNLSRGEMNRLILGLSWSFRDVWESLYQPINLLFLDEVIDNGTDSAGVENALAILKHMSRERQRSVWLISHREELSSRVSNVLKVVKEGGFTQFVS